MDLIVQRYGDELLAFVINNRPSGNSPEDVTQEVWLRVWRSRDSFQEDSLRGWIYSIARNFICDQHRKKRPDLIEPEYDPAAPEHDPPDPRLEALQSCVESLSSVFMDAVRAQLAGLTMKEIAQLFDIPDGTVYSRLSRGRADLKNCVERKMR